VIQITKVIQPERGSITMARCVSCGEVLIQLDEDSERPSEGDLWVFEINHAKEFSKRRPYFADTVSR